MQSHTTLYLKQFMHNFVQTTTHRSSLNLLHTSLEVLEGMVDGFINTQSIDTNEIERTDCTKSLSNLEKSLTNSCERVYGKVRAILEWAEDKTDNSSSCKTSQRSFHVQGDEQLYQILNEYKHSNKSLKMCLQSTNEKLSIKTGDLMQFQVKNENLVAEVSNLRSIIESSRRQISQNLEIIREQTDKVEKLEVQHSQNLKQNKKLCFEIQRICMQSSKMSQDVQKLRNQKAMLQKQIKSLQRDLQHGKNEFANLKTQYEYKIQQSLSKIPQIIQSKLNNHKNWENASVQSLKKYISVHNRERQQNITPISKLNPSN